jgi:peptidoglycan hydrolase-like protein with peptidoglycan-binding domain
MFGKKLETLMCRRSFLQVLTVTLLLAGFTTSCTESTTNTPSPLNADSGQELPIPAQILSSRTIDIDQLEVEVVVNGERVQATRQGNIWQVSIQVSPGDNLSLTVTWFENFEGTRLPLASWQDSLSVQDNQTININSTDYVTDIFDNDGDGVSNLAERDAGTPPLPAAQVSDMDSDGVLDASDNCPATVNTDQADDDADSEGNVCDDSPRGPDADADGIPALDDNCPNFADPTNACNEPLSCGGEPGTDAESLDLEWGNNCQLQRGGEHVDSYYTQGVERILFCLGHHGPDDTINGFADGFFGAATETAVLQFQMTAGITADGIVGAETWGVLQDSLTLLSNGESRDAYGFEGLECMDQILFYQRVGDTSGGAPEPGEWTMAEPVGGPGAIEFSINPVPR